MAVLSARDHGLREYSPGGQVVGSRSGLTATADANGGLPTAFAIDAGGRVWFADANAARGGGPAQLARAAQGGAIRAMGVAAAPGRLFVMLPPSAPYMFATISLVSGRELRFGRLLSNQAADGVETFGSIALDRNRQVLYYAATYVGVIGAWTVSGGRVFLRRTVASLPPPELVHVAGGERIPFHAPYSCLDLCFSGGVIYLLTEVPPGSKLPTSVLDEYDGRTGAYIGSLRLPERCRQFAVHGNLLATSSIHGTAVWRIKWK